MRERPEGADLLQAARILMQDQLLPSLTGSQRHAARMIMRAIDLAARELRAGTEPDSAEHAGLKELLATPEARRSAPEAEPTTLIDLNRQLITLIRAGNADPETQLRDATLAHLRAVARQRVQQSNPKLLTPPRSL